MNVKDRYSRNDRVPFTIPADCLLSLYRRGSRGDGIAGAHELRKRALHVDVFKR